MLQTTQLAEGHGVLLDTNMFGAVPVREPLNIMTGSNGDDLVGNLQRYVARSVVRQVIPPGLASGNSSTGGPLV